MSNHFIDETLSLIRFYEKTVDETTQATKSPAHQFDSILFFTIFNRDFNMLKHKKIFIKMETLLVLVFFYLPSSFNKPLKPSVCRDDQVTYRKNGSTRIHCWTLIKMCPVGMGLKFKFVPGKVYQWGTFNTGCESCKTGITFSDIEDYSQCENCTQCRDNERSVGQCYYDKDEIQCTGQCKEGFYWSNASCIACSQCCRDIGNCASRCPPDLSSKNCTLTANETHSTINANGTQSNNITNRTVTNSTSPSNGKIPSDHEDDGSPKDDANTKGSVTPGQLVLAILCSLFLLCALLIFACLTCKARRTQPGNRPNRFVIHYDNIDAQPVFKKLDVSSVESTEVDCPSSTTLVASSADHAVNCLLQGNEVPIKLDESCNEENGTASQRQVNNQVVLVADSLKVKDMPLMERLEICRKFDETNKFFTDYRSLGTGLGMTNMEVNQLGNESSPTSCILQKYKETDLEVFRQEVKEIEDLRAGLADSILTDT